MEMCCCSIKIQVNTVLLFFLILYQALSSPDSFILNVRVKNEEDFYRKMGDTMDLSNLPRNHSFYDNTNEKGNFFYHKKNQTKKTFSALFFFKDETAGDPIVLTILMRPKSYAILTRSQLKKWQEDTDSRSWLTKNKGVNSGVTKLLNPCMYLYSLTRKTKIMTQIKKIASKNHKISIQKIRKNSLNHCLTKHRLKNCNLHVVSYGTNADMCDCCSK